MSESFVVVQAQWTDGNGHYSSGNFEMIASGMLMDSASVALVIPVISYQLDSLGALSVPTGFNGSVGTGAPNSGVSLLASDNFGAGELTWDFKIVVQGIPTINVADVQVNYAAGASQGLFTILEAAGWTPDVF